MARNLRKDLLAAECRAADSESKADMARVVALREELSRVERGEL